MNRLPLALALSLCLYSWASASTPIDDTRALNPDAELTLENVKGRIVVHVWERAEIQIRGSLGEGTDGLEVVGDAAMLRVKVKYPESKGWFGGWGGGDAKDSDLLVTVPAGISLTIEGVAASIEVRGVAGKELAIDSVSGDVVVSTGAADVEIATVSGNQKITANSAQVSAESVSGDVDIDGQITGRVDLEAVSGDLRLNSASAVKQVDAGVVSGDIELRTGLLPGGRINAESLSGDLVLILPAGTSAKVEASSFNGTIDSAQGKVATEEYGPGSSLSTTLGGGDGRIELETFSGDLTLRQE